MKRDELLSRLERLLPAQFEGVLFHLQIPSAQLAGASAPQSIRAIELLRHLENTGELARLEPLLLSYDDAAGVSRVSAQPPAATKPVPLYLDAEVEALSKRLENARSRKKRLCDSGIKADDLDREILELRRQLREGGQLRAGDALSDGRYLLVRVVGRGGFAVVWEAFDCAEQQRVAIKVLHLNLAGDPLRRERFFRGAHAMMKLVHPAVVRVLEPKGEDGGFYYFVMEFVADGNLREWVLQSRLKNEETLPVILRIGEALALAHSQGMIHRDIKPANILLNEHGTAKLTDFDLVGARDTTGGTRTGALGTIVYAAPECLERPQEAAACADVYGLGMTAIFCLAGRNLSMDTFRNPEGTIDRLHCSIQVQAVLRRAVAWEPHERFADAAAMVLKLREALDPPEHGGAALVYSARADPPAFVPGLTIVSQAVVSQAVEAGFSSVEAGSASVEAAHERMKTGRWWQLTFGVICMVMIANLQSSWTLFATSSRHWDRAQIQTAFIIFVLIENWLAPVGGWLVDRFGPRAVVVTGSVLCALGWEKSAYANSLPFLYVAWGIAGIGASAVYGTCVGNALKWFPERRGLAVGITGGGFGAGATATVLLQWASESYGYEATFLWFGFGQGAVLFIIGLLLSHPDANAVAALPKPSNVLTNRPQFNSRQMMKTSVFWVMYVMFVLVGASGLFVTASLKQIAEALKVSDMQVVIFGLAPTAITAALIFGRIMNGIARPFFGWVSDRVGRENTMFIAFGIEAWGEIYSLFPSTSADTYGWKHAAANAGWLYTAKGTAAFFVPFAANSASWHTVFMVAAAINGLAAVMALVVLKPLRQRMLRHGV
ncbi:MAG: oxalate/formate MFS antiporter [Deltaproteobacteria bacterium]|nr:MAG: oxalate/formate MFS antiporter [Deltaproteobacteria bacterium]